MSTDPISALFQSFTDLFSGGSSGGGSSAPGSAYDKWSPWLPDGSVMLARDWPTAEPGSLRSGLRQATGPKPRPQSGNTDTNKKASDKVNSKGTWTSRNETWQSLDSYQKAAAMALLEADGANPDHAKNITAAMVNRATQRKLDLGKHVSSRTYQPTFEPAQEARLESILKHKAFASLVDFVQRYEGGEEDDPTRGATHYLAHEKVMVGLYNKNPDKYHNWGPFKNSKGVPGKNWTRYDPATGSYEDVRFRDKSHAFVAPEGTFSVPRK